MTAPSHLKILHEQEYKQGRFQVYNDKPDFPVIHCHQVHSSTVIEYQGEKTESIKADGLIIDPVKFPNQVLAIKTADCLPILLIGKKVALIHAGWKGLQNKILQSKALHPLDITDIYIGPSMQNYEVTEEFKQHFPDSNKFSTRNNKLYFNLQSEACRQLHESFPYAKITDSNICTKANIEYNSYRRDKTNIRNWNIFKINKT